MMQRKKNTGSRQNAITNADTTGVTSGAPPSISSAASSASGGVDDGGSAKFKSSYPLLAPLPLRMQAMFGSAPPSNHSSNTFPKSGSGDAPSYCLPGVPVALKFVLLSFLGFAALIVFTAHRDHRGHHHAVSLGGHRHPRRGRGGMMHEGMLHGIPRMPETLHEHLKQSAKRRPPRVDTEKEYSQEIGDETMNSSQRMLAHPSRFVDSEKKLKQQLRQLLEKQNSEKNQFAKSGEKNPLDNKSILGVKISNRFLGEDLLPFPNSKGEEKEWSERMEKRKEELRKLDEEEWKEMMQEYDEIMDNLKENEDHQDHSMEELEEIGDAEHVEMEQASLNTKIWPSPSEKAGPGTTILLKPAFGSHRSSSNAIFVFAEGYDLSIYLAFVESLVNTGYTGDVVFSISDEERLKPGVKEYLQSKSQSGGINIVAYEVLWSCFDHSGIPASGSKEGSHNCQMNSVFGNASGETIADPREPRPVATARYELYWMWSLQYESQIWIMLIDVRDTWFQLDPFKGMSTKNAAGEEISAGELHLFGENSEAITIGKSSYNRNWLTKAYGANSVSQYFDEPVICSGSTIGQQIAIQSYLRAMVAQFDMTECKAKGCDQGFHNYLYYSGQLGNKGSDFKAEGISKVIVHEQGKGIINNLGALREKPLSEQGLYNAEKKLILNWDGSTSAVAHQYDRDKEVNSMVKASKRLFQKQWEDRAENLTPR